MYDANRFYHLIFIIATPSGQSKKGTEYFVMILTFLAQRGKNGSKLDKGVDGDIFIILN